jgi:hypothetical protein
MTNEQIEAEFKHLATKQDVALVRADLEKALREQLKWLIGTMVMLQIPTWVGMLQIWAFLANIAAHLPKS